MCPALPLACGGVWLLLAAYRLYCQVRPHATCRTCHGSGHDPNRRPARPHITAGTDRSWPCPQCRGIGLIRRMFAPSRW